MRLRVTVEGKPYDVEVEFLQDPYAGDARPTVEDSPDIAIPESVLRTPPPEDLPEDRICRSPIAGVVTSVLAAAGQRVNKDDPLLTIEAMKMESRIGAPVAGVVKLVHVLPGAAVRAGEVLVELS